MNSILFNTEMTKAILDGRKVQTRRVIKVDPVHWDSPTLLEPDSCVKFHFSAGGCQNHSSTSHFENSKYQIGKTIWVREPAKIIEFNEVGNYGGFYNDSESFVYEYVADGEVRYFGEIPERFKNTPKWIMNCQGIPNGCIKEMARIFLKITNVRVESLQDILFEDILLEGCNIELKDMVMYDDSKKKTSYSAYKWYRGLWNKTAPKGYKWEDNPYVFVYEFERVER